MTFRTPPPGLFWSAYFTLSLGVTLKGLSDDVSCWLLQRVADPSPFPFLDLLLNRDLPSSLLEVLVGNHLWPSDAKDDAEASVD
jgi:hypothetical protein